MYSTTFAFFIYKEVQVGCSVHHFDSEFRLTV